MLATTTGLGISSPAQGKTLNQMSLQLSEKLVTSASLSEIAASASLQAPNPTTQMAQVTQEQPDRLEIGPILAPRSEPRPQPSVPSTITPTAPTEPSRPSVETAPIQPQGTPLPALETAPQSPASETGTPTTPTQPQPGVSGETPAPGGIDQPSETQPGTDSGTTTPPQQTTEPEPEPRVLVAEVAVQGAEGKLLDEVYRVIRTQPGRTATRSQIQEDINAIFATGYFSNVRATPEDTPLGVRVTFEVTVNPVLQSVKVEGTKVLPEPIVESAFKDQYGETLNLVRLQEGIKQLNKWYQDNGYVLAQVIGSPKVSPDGVVTLEIAEGVVEKIEVRCINKEGSDTDAKGNPIRCRTRPFIVTREMEIKPGDVFNRKIVERDLQRIFGLGIFDDVRLALNPGTDPRQVIVVPNVVEKNAGSIAAGAGISSASGLFGTVSYQQNNFGGNNQRLGAEIQVGQRELLFDLSFTDPWIAGDPFRTSYTLNFFRRRTINLNFDGGNNEVNLANGDTPRVVRTGGGISFSRQLNPFVFIKPEWVASLGFQYQQVQTTDADGRVFANAVYGNPPRFEPLTWSRTGTDDLFSIQFGVVQDKRNDPLRPTSGSLLRLGTEQWLPIGAGSILGNRLRGGYSFYIPTQLVRFTKGCQAVAPRPADCPQTFAFNFQAGTVVGDLPPYEAFSLGGANSVRGYGEGELGSARTFIQGTFEYRFPVFSIISGALFFDGAYDFGSQGLVLGNPGGIREKPGSGFGYGLGVRIQSPLGPIRIDWGFNNEGGNQLSFGIGERF